IVALRGPPGPPAGDPASPRAGRAAFPFPELVPLGVAGREGVFTIAVSPAYRAWPNPPAAGQPANTFAYPYAGREPGGMLTLTPGRPWVAVAGDTAVSLAGDRVTAVTRLRAGADAGQLGPMTVFAPDGGWEWSAEPAAA